jgi:glycerol dehydrogenase-like iron-containing ADH family enzyme
MASPRDEPERPVPPLEFGRDMLEQYAAEFRDALIVTMDVPWKAFSKRVDVEADAPLMVETMERETVEAVEQNLPPVDTVVGLGGGMALDMAKYVAWKRGARLILVPSIMSVDACVTREVAIREGRRVRYVGDVRPEVVVVDYELIRGAPARLNRAGAGDILSIHTALFDWKLAHAEQGERYDPAIADDARGILQKLMTGWRDIRDVTDGGIRILAELFAAVNELCFQFGNSRPEEGSEHFWAYNVEYLTGRQFIHGELVCLGIVLMAALQDNLADEVHRFLEGAQVRYRPEDLHLSRDDLVRSLLSLKEYVEKESLMFSIINMATIDTGTVDEILSRFLRNGDRPT